ncbi:MAG: hypothetical protein QOD39_2695 [Mycobacterium sp.]|nr:hypothetical protein [Mycobacterium sp.]
MSSVLAPIGMSATPKLAYPITGTHTTDFGRNSFAERKGGCTLNAVELTGIQSGSFKWDRRP